MQMSMCGIRRACYFSQNGQEFTEVLTDATPYIALLEEAALTKKMLATTV